MCRDGRDGSNGSKAVLVAVELQCAEKKKRRKGRGVSAPVLCSVFCVCVVIAPHRPHPSRPADANKNHDLQDSISCLVLPSI